MYRVGSSECSTRSAEPLAPCSLSDGQRVIFTRNIAGDRQCLISTTQQSRSGRNPAAMPGEPAWRGRRRSSSSMPLWLGACSAGQPAAPAPAAPVATAEPPVTVQRLPRRRRSIDCHPTARRPDRPGAEHDRRSSLGAHACSRLSTALRARAASGAPAAAMLAPAPPPPARAYCRDARAVAPARGCRRDARRRTLALPAGYGRADERARSGRNPGLDLPSAPAGAVAKIAIAAGDHPARRYCTASSRRNR